jgi:hypothetical protein
MGGTVWKVRTTAGRLIGQFDSSHAAHALGLWKVKTRAGKVRGEYTSLSEAQANAKKTDTIARVKLKVYKQKTRARHEQSLSERERRLSERERKVSERERKVSAREREIRAEEAATETPPEPTPIPPGWVSMAESAKRTEAALLASEQATPKDADRILRKTYPDLDEAARVRAINTVAKRKPEWRVSELTEQERAVSRVRNFVAELLGPDAKVKAVVNADGTVDAELRFTGGLDFLMNDEYVPTLRKVEEELDGFWLQFGSRYNFPITGEQGKYRSQGIFPPRFAHPQRASVWAHNLQWAVSMQESMGEKGYDPVVSYLRIFWNPEGKQPDRKGTLNDDKDWDT